MELFSCWVFLCPYPGPTRGGQASEPPILTIVAPVVPVHSPPSLCLCPGSVFLHLSEGFNLNNSLAQWLLTNATSSKSLPAGSCCLEGKAIKRSHAGLVSLFFPGRFNPSSLLSRSSRLLKPLTSQAAHLSRQLGAQDHTGRLSFCLLLPEKYAAPREPRDGVQPLPVHRDLPTPAQTLLTRDSTPQRAGRAQVALGGLILATKAMELLRPGCTSTVQGSPHQSYHNPHAELFKPWIKPRK